MNPVYLVELKAIIEDGHPVEPLFGIVSRLLAARTADVVLWSTEYTDDQAAHVQAWLNRNGWNIAAPEQLILRFPKDNRPAVELKSLWLSQLPYTIRVAVSGAFELDDTDTIRMLSDNTVPLIFGGLFTYEERTLH